jgi:2-C-methyl-D-erythritol 4-phosphate cytidylyltransferase
MQKQSKFICVVPAGGTGSRFGSDVPKQYLSLGDCTVLGQTLRQLIAVEAIERIYVVTSPEKVEQATSCLDAISDSDRERVEVLPLAGATRAKTVANGLSAAFAALDDPTQDCWALVHDAARPLASPEQVMQLIAEAVDNDGAILAVPVADTLKAQGESARIQNTVSREGLWQAQTPQCFRLIQLLDALEAAENSKKSPTDEAQAMEWHVPECRVKLVMGDSRNIKITRSADLAYAQWLMQSQPIK